MKNLILTLIITLPLTLWGQGWEQVYFDYIQKINQVHLVHEENDGYIVMGKLASSLKIIKTNFLGDTLWTETPNYQINDLIDCDVTDDGGFIVIGRSGGSVDYVLLKLNNIGQVQWSQEYGPWINNTETISEVIQTTDGGFIIVGTGTSWDGFSVRYDTRIIKTNSIGDTLWTKQYGLINKDETGKSIRETDDGGLIISGMETNQNLFGQNNLDIHLYKIDVNGDQQWNKTYGRLDDDYCSQVRQTSDGGYITCGLTTQSFGLGIYDIYLIKTNSNGDTLWTKTFGGTQSEYVYDIEQTFDGGYIITGSTSSFGSGSSDVYLIKTDGNGIEQWSQTYGNTLADVGFDVEQTSDGGYIICGIYYNDPPNLAPVPHLYLIKTDGNGNITSTFNIPTLSSNRKLEKVIDILGRETKPHTNTPFIEIFDDGSTVKKIIIEK